MHTFERARAFPFPHMSHTDVHIHTHTHTHTYIYICIYTLSLSLSFLSLYISLFHSFIYSLSLSLSSFSVFLVRFLSFFSFLSPGLHLYVSSSSQNLKTVFFFFSYPNICTRICVLRFISKGLCTHSFVLTHFVICMHLAVNFLSPPVSLRRSST